MIVVGAGPAGATLAYLLASRGISVTLLERHRDFNREFRGEVLLPSGLKALQQMGLGDLITRIPHVVPTSFELYSNARLSLRIPFHPHLAGPGPLIALSQPAFLAAVIERARAFPSFRVELGIAASELLVTGERILHSDLVIGADGRNSTIRKACALKARKHGMDFDVVWFKTALPVSFRHESPFRGHIGSGHLLIAYPAAGGSLQVAWLIAKGSYGELRHRGMTEWIEEMAQHVTPDLGSHLRTHSRSLANPFLLSTVSDRVTPWSIPGALVIGDAAHTMSPVGAQGINMALRDAVVAANRLIPVLRQTRDCDRILAATQAIEDDRTPELRYIQRLQAIQPRIVLSRSLEAAAFRATVPRLLRFEAVRRAAASIGLGNILFGWGDVRLQV